MRRPTLLLPAALAATLLLTACGSERAGTRNGGVGADGSTPRTRVTQPAVDGVRITSVTVPSTSASSSPAATATSPDGIVRAERLPTGIGDSDGPGISAAYEVTNSGAQAMTYTVLFEFTTSAGEVMSNQHVTVASVGAGRTVKGTVRLGVLGPGASRVTTVKVGQVTKVPAAEAPAKPGVCPPSGIRLTADDGDAAMGLRVVGLHLENCGNKDYTLNGYPELTLLDEDREPVDGIRILHGGDSISGATGYDDPPRPLTLKPGETALSGLIWRNTTQAGTAVNVPYVRVRAKAGAAPVTVTPHLDLGTTGKLGVGAWKRAER
ncbi:DUF4232 domain-containing protein [Streptomyces sp. 3214.6]|uniref:DUF4232 domain-containing protein n=1 Tax=Streptomyces sp. 3214.6 TaxID=1882757 RepID=UPI00090A007E|nr:DUF4232 domain-containing protein [Streptomyces sp. 3214.6]SHH85623.1 Protein of unknown function [Streptomyces sp. 3214.6]